MGEALTAGRKGQDRGAGKWSLRKCERVTFPARASVCTGGVEGPTPLDSVQTTEPGPKDPFFKMIRGSHWGEESLVIKCDTIP